MSFILSKSFKLKYLFYIIIFIFIPEKYTFPQNNNIKIPLSLTVSGGVSLGSYMSGYLYYTTELIKRNENLFDVPIVTGASAGSINALLSIISLCQDISNNPKESLFWKTWYDLDYKSLVNYEDGGSSRFSLFSNSILKKIGSQVALEWEKGLNEKCNKILGISVTRKDPYYIKVAENSELSRLEEKFLLQIKGAGKNKSPIIKNYILEDYSNSQSLLYLGEPTEKVQTPYLRDLLLSSAAFPLAFPPYILNYCFIDEKNPSCYNKNKRSNYFIDGGVFDNQPMRLAYKAVQQGLNVFPNGSVVWSDKPQKNNKGATSKVRFFNLNLNSTAYPVPSNMESDTVLDDISLTRYVANSVQMFIEHARSKELYSLLELDPSISEKIRSSVTFYPRISDHIGAFFGFFEHSFREFDFYLGMYDAQRIFKTLSSKGSLKNYKINYPGEDISSNSQDFEGWKPLFCMRSFFDRETQFKQYCPTEINNFLILLQVSMNRLYSYCSTLPTNDLENIFNQQDCISARKGDPPPILFDNNYKENWKAKKNESDFEHTMRMLEEYNFYFKDLGLSPDDAHFGMNQLIRELKKTISEFSKKQFISDRVLISVISEPTLNLLSYTPIESYNYFTLGRALEIGRSFHPSIFDTNLDNVRLNLALQFTGLFSIFSSNQPLFAITPLIGPEFELTYINNAAIQSRIGFRGGYQFSFNDNLISKGCATTSKNNPDSNSQCSAPVVQGIYSLSLYERIRFSLIYESTFLNQIDNGPYFWNILFGVGLQF